MRSRSFPTRAFTGATVGLLSIGLGLGSLVPARPAAASGSAADFAQAGGAATAVALHGRFAYAGVGASLVVLDLANPMLPAALAPALPLPEVVDGLAVDQGHLYAATRESVGSSGARLWTFDLTDPERPRPVGKALALPAREVGALAARFGFIVVATETGVLVLDTKRPAMPRLLSVLPAGISGRFGSGGALAIDAQGLAWIAGRSGLHTVDLAGPSPGRMVERHHLATRAVVALGPQVFALTESGDLEVWPAGGDALEPELLHALATAPRAIAATEGRLLVLDLAGRRLRRFAIGGPAGPAQDQQTWIAAQESERAALAASGPRLVAALERGGLVSATVGDLASQGRPSEPVLPPIVHLHQGGLHALASADTAGLWVLDLADPAQPKVAGALQVLAEDEVGDARWVLDDPTSPSALAQSGDRRAVAFRSALAIGGLAFACTAADGLFAIDWADPRAPRLLGQLPEAPACHPGTDMVGRAGHLYLSTEERRLAIVDISQPGAMRLVSAGDAGGIQDLMTLALEGEQLFAAGYAAITAGSLQVLDLSDPARPQPRARLDLDRAYAKLAVAYGRAFLSGSFGSVAIVDFVAPDRLIQRPTFAGIVAGKLGLYDTLAFAAGPGHLDTFLTSSSGQLYPLGRVTLPWAGEGWIGGSDVTIAGGRVAILRGRAGLFTTTGPDGLLDPDAAAPPPPASLPGATPPAGSANGPPASAPTPAIEVVCASPAPVILVADSMASAALAPPADLFDRGAGSASALQAFAATFEPGAAEIGLGSFGEQGELLAMGADPSTVLAAWAARDEPDAPSGNRWTRVDLGLAVAAQALAVEGDGPPPASDAAAGRVAGRGMVILIAAGGAEPTARRLAPPRAAALAAAGHRLHTVALGHDADRAFLAGLADRPEHAHAVQDPADLAPLLGRLGAEAGRCRVP